MSENKSQLTISDSDGVRVVNFEERKILDELSISRIGDELSELIAGIKEVRLLLSFQNVEHLSSAALGMLISLNKQVGEQNGQLKLSDISPQIYEVFKITRLNKLFTIHGTQQEALGAF